MKTQKNATNLGIFIVLAILLPLFAACNNKITGPEDPTVTEVIINITTSSVVEKGGTLVFTATVIGTNNPDQGVDWTIDESYKNPQTVINPSASAGILNISPNETCNFLTVRATSTLDSSKSGTLVVAIYAPGQLPTVSAVTVSPSSASVAKGGTQTFTAGVTGTNNPPNTVTWSIVQPNKNAGTVIDANGKLTVSSAETLSSLTVRATSTVDNATSGTATVTVTTPTPPPTAGNGLVSFPIGPSDVYADEGYWDSENNIWVRQITKVTAGSYDGSYAYLERYDSDAKESSYTPLSAYINSPTTVQITNNKLTINLGTPKNLTAVADMMGFLLGGDLNGIEIKPINSNAKMFAFFGEQDSFCSQDGVFLFYGDYSEECYISFCYVDNDVTITGTVPGEASFALNLKRGWNYVKWTDTGYENPDFDLYQTAQPGSDAKWFVNIWGNSEGGTDGPDPVRQLSQPSNLQVSGTTLTWNAVENAIGYMVSIGGAEYQAYTNSYSLSGFFALETYTIQVKANGDGTAFTDSSWSSIQYTVQAATPAINQQPSDASYFTGETITALTVNATTSDDGVIGYQWYSSTTTSDSSLVAGWTSVGTTNGGNTKTFTPPATAGTVYYYALVTNTKTFTMPLMATASSRAAMISVTNPVAVTSNATITINTAEKKQYVRGFGGMDVPWANFPGQSTADTEKMYSPDGLGFNIMRVMIMPPGLEDGNYTSHDVMVNNLLNNGRPDYINNVKIVNKYDGYVLATPWTPPKEWKSNNSINGNNGNDGDEDGYLLETHYGDYARYLKEFCQLMYSRGAPIYAVSIQNEPNYAAPWESCLWNADQMRDFFKEVGQLTQGVSGYGGGKQIPRVLVMNGESEGTPSINFPALEDSVSRAAIDLYGRHLYGGYTDTLWQSSYADYHEDSTYQTECWMTEHIINSGPDLFERDCTWNYVWKFLNDVDLTIRLNNENTFIWWASKRFYSLIGDGQYGTYEDTVLPRGYALSHYAKFAKETWQVGVTYTGTNAGGTNLSASNFNQSSFNTDNTQVRATAFVSPDGNTISVVLFTPTDTSGENGINMGDVKIQLPVGFAAKSGVAMRSDSSGKRAQMESVALSADRNSAVVNLPASTILSLRFTK